MDNQDSVTGVLLDEAALDLEEMARACGVEPDWVRRHVQAGVLVLEDAGGADALQADIVAWRFRSNDLNRARRLASIERDFDANEELAALVVDLADEVRRLRVRLNALGLR
jgi:chaperone modulatory protein CbpM